MASPSSVVKKPRNTGKVRTRSRPTHDAASSDTNHGNVESLFSHITPKKVKQRVSIIETLANMVVHHPPTLETRAQCTNIIDNGDDELTDMLEGVKLAFLAYAFPAYWRFIGTPERWAWPNNHFHHYESLVSQELLSAKAELHDMYSQDTAPFLELPSTNKVAGFYLHTPVRVFTKETHRPVVHIPPSKKREKLLKYRILGGVNMYVMMESLSDSVDGSYRLYVLFRGTHNHWNGIPQYGKHQTGNTPLFQRPTTDPLTGRHYPKGSSTKPLFMSYYVDLLNDIKPYLYRTLEELGIESPDCERVTVAGHSQGAALTQLFCYVVFHERPSYFVKMDFREISCPLSCNYSAIKAMEHFLAFSGQRHKYVSAVNTDDLMNVRYHLGGNRDTIVETIKEGFEGVLSETLRLGGLAVADGLRKKTKRDHVFAELIRRYPELAVSAFLNASMRHQMILIPSDRSVGFRFGHTEDRVSQWETPSLREEFRSTLQVVLCERQIDFERETVGRSHDDIGDILMSWFHAGTRAFENELYEEFHRETLQSPKNRLFILPLFPKVDRRKALRMSRRIAQVTPYVPHEIRNAQKSNSSSRRTSKM